MKFKRNAHSSQVFRHLTTVAQANDFNIDKIKEHFKDELKTQFDNIRLEQRTQCTKKLAF